MRACVSVSVCVPVYVVGHDANCYTRVLYFMCTSACVSAGLSVSDRSLKALMMRYADKQDHIRFNDFVACFIKLKTMMSKQVIGTV